MSMECAICEYDLRAGCPYGADCPRKFISAAEKKHAEEIAPLRDAVAAAARFFEEAMPKMNVGASALDANAIDAWNKAEIAVTKAAK